jgi:23S rRNA (uracil1939-C5)-methyltransferase
MVLSNGPCKVLYGDGWIQDEMCGLKFRISARSFYQVNATQAARLYTIAMRMARFKGNESIIDAYCGTGTIGLIAASWGAGHVTGIELNPDAVEDAKENARLNGLENVDFICADASSEMKEMAKAGTPVDTVFLDPPRSGSDERFLASLIRLNPRTVVYISCNPETLARDLRYLTKMGPYRMIGAQPVDMFPQTGHVETVVLISHT